MAYGDLKCRNLIWNSGSGDNTVVLSTLLTSSSPNWTGTATGVNLTLSGNLTVSGTQTIINTSVLDVEDINITLGKVSSPSDTTANNGGITLKGATDKTFNWLNATDSWTSSEHIEIASGKNLKVDGTTFFVDGTNNRVGIGTASPTKQVEIRATGPQISLVSDANGISELQFGDTADAVRGNILYRAGSAGDALCFNGYNNTERMRIDNSGRVGIGTTSPSTSYKAHIKNTTWGLLKLETDLTGADGSYLALYHNSSSPADGDQLGVLEFKGKNSANEELSYAQIQSRSSDVTDGTEDGYLAFQTIGDGTFAERMRIDSSGKVGINITPSANGGLAQIGNNLVYTDGATNLLTSASKAAFRIKTSSNSSKSLFFGGIDEHATPYLQAANLGNDGATALYSIILNPFGGGVGIGDSFPDAVLSIKGDSNADSNPSIRLKDGTDTRETWISNVSGDLYLAAGGNDNVYHSRIRLMDGNAIYFDTANGLRASINADGVSDAKGNLRDIPKNSQANAYTLVAADAGKFIEAQNGVTIPSSVFSSGQAITILNQTGSDITLTSGSGVTLYNAADASTGNRTLASRGLATVLFASGSTAHISGAGLS